MQHEVETLVHRVLRHGIQLKERLRQGETFDLRNEQAVLKRLLLTEEQARQLPDYGSDAVGFTSQEPVYGTPLTTQDRAGTFLGIRYALVCWLDELFLIDSPWDAQWNETKLEQSLYGSNDRAWKFWEQAKLGDKRPGLTALKTYFLCVMLGFRGDFRDDTAFLTAWVDATRRRLTQDAPGDWPKPPDRDIKTSVPPLYGRDALRRMVIACGTLLLILIPVVSFFFVKYMDQTTPGTNATREGRGTGYGVNAKKS